MKLLLGMAALGSIPVLIAPLIVLTGLGTASTMALCSTGDATGSPEGAQSSTGVVDGSCRTGTTAPGGGIGLELQGSPTEIAAAVEAALALNGIRSGWKGLCDRLACRAYGYSNSGYNDATTHWNALLASGHAHPGSRCPPTGAFAFWSTRHAEGHVALVVRGDPGCDPRRTMVISNDVLDRQLHGNGGVYLVSLDDIESGFMRRAGYRGWTDPICGGSPRAWKAM